MNDSTGLPKYVRRERHTEPALRDVIPLGVYLEEVPKLEKHLLGIEYLTVYAVRVHEDHKRFVVYCTARRGAERLVPKVWAGFPVTRRMGVPEGFAMSSQEKGEAR